MKHINSFEKHNESWRQAKAYLRLPALLIDNVMSKVLDYVPKLNFLYNSMAAKIDTGTSFNSGPGTTIKDDVVKIQLSDIKDDKVRKSLMLSGLLKSWNIYRLDREYQGKTAIYISKDELKKGDPVHGERISKDADTEFYVIAAKHSSEHDDMKVERKNRYDKKKHNELVSKVENAIKDKGRRINRIMYSTSSGDFTPLFHTIILAGYFDLVKKVLDSVNNPDTKREMLVKKFGRDGMNRNAKEALKLETTPEIKELLDKTIYELWLQKNSNK